MDKIIDIARRAGEEILKVYNDPDKYGAVEIKADNSPLTKADKDSHILIMRELSKISSLPIISEEEETLGYDIRKNWEEYWLVDPLDGTKEFINRNGEFTVNISLIKNKNPILGVIHVPVKDITYFGKLGEGAYLKRGKNNPIVIKVNNKSTDLIAVRSKSHATEEEETVLSNYGISDSISVGSSLKFCMVAEGKADIYYRHGPTMEWDIAAGHAILKASGGNVYKGSTTDQPFTYNKEDLLNGSFIALGF